MDMAITNGHYHHGATPFALDEFLQNHVEKCADSYISCRQVFIAYRMFLTVKYPSRVGSMDYRLFKHAFQQYSQKVRFSKLNMERKVFYLVKFCRLKELEDMQTQNKIAAEKEDVIMVKARDLNSFITCKLCTGYLVQPCTILECLHSFCKSCIVKHFYTSLRCPFCDALVSERNPFDHIKRDMVMQNIMDNLLPGLIELERNRSQKFERQQENSNISFKNTNYVKTIDFSLEWVGPDKCTITTEQIVDKYTRVNADATIAHVKQLVLECLGKADGDSLTCDIFSGDINLPSFLTLDNVANYKLIRETKKKIPVFRYDIRPLDNDTSLSNDVK